MKQTAHQIRLALLFLSLCFLPACGKSEEQAQKEADEQALDAVSASIEGTVTALTGSKISIRTSDNTLYTFDMSKAELKCKSGIIPGNETTLIYVGKITGTDTTKVRLRKIITSDDNSGLISQKDTEAAAANPLPIPIDEPGYEMPGSGVTVEEDVQTIVAQYPLNVRADPKNSAEILGALNKGEEASQTGVCDNGWRRIEFDGQTGYVWGELVK